MRHVDAGNHAITMWPACTQTGLKVAMLHAVDADTTAACSTAMLFDLRALLTVIPVPAST
jgi:hypothetical protein